MVWIWVATMVVAVLSKIKAVLDQEAAMEAAISEEFLERLRWNSRIRAAMRAEVEETEVQWVTLSVPSVGTFKITADEAVVLQREGLDTDKAHRILRTALERGV
jgi:hypothetical protein